MTAGCLLAGVGDRRGGRARVQELVEAVSAARVPRADPEHGRLRTRGHALGERGVEDDRLRRALREDERELGPLLPGVDRYGDCAEPKRREQYVYELAPIAEYQGDAIAARDAEPMEVSGEPRR